MVLKKSLISSNAYSNIKLYIPVNEKIKKQMIGTFISKFQRSSDFFNE